MNYYLDALKMIQRDLRKGTLEEMLELYARHSNSFTYAADDGPDDYDEDNVRLEREKEAVSILESMIACHVMREHGYYTTDASGYHLWEREPQW